MSMHPDRVMGGASLFALVLAALLASTAALFDALWLVIVAAVVGSAGIVFLVWAAFWERSSHSGED
ncbi:MAG: hypothetical protein ACYDBQ_01845 [Thermoplasmatota archaeon]